MATGPEIINRQFSSNRLMLRGLIGFDSDGNPVIVRSDTDGVVKVQIEGIFNGTTRTPIAVDIDGKLESSASITAHVDGLESLTQELIDLFKWERFDEIVEDGGYMYFGFRSRTDSTYLVKRIKDDTHAAAYCYGDGELPASAEWTGLVYA